MTEQPRPQPGDGTGEASRGLQGDGSRQVPDPDFGGATDAVFGEEPEPGVTAADALGGPGAGEVEDEFMRRGVEDRARRLRQSGISRIFERATGGVKLGAKEAFRLTSAIVSRAANTKVFGQNLTSSLDYALHHKKEMVTDAVAGAVGGGVAGGLGKAAVRAALAGTGGLLATAAIGAVGGAAAGGVTEYLRQRKKIDIDKAEGALVIAGLRNEFRRIKGADKKRIRNAALRGAVFGAIGGVIGVEFADNPWVQEHIAKIRLPEIKLPEVKLPEVKLPEIRPPEFKFKGTAPADLPPSQAPGFPEVSSPVVAPPEATVAPATPTVEPTATPAPMGAVPEATPTVSPAIPATPTVEPTATPTVSPTGTPIPTETPTPAPTAEATATPVGVAPRATPPPVSLDELSPPAAPAQELTPAQPPAVPVRPGMEPVIGQPAVMPPTEPLALVEPAPAELPIPAELSAVPEQIPLPAGSNPWEVTGRTLRDVLGRNPTNAEILQITKEVCRQSNISVPNWEITGEIDHRQLPINYKLVFNDPVKKLIAGIKG